MTLFFFAMIAFVIMASAANIHQLQDDHFIKNGLPGQPEYGVKYKQYAGNIPIGEESERSLFYYFVEPSFNSSAKPLVLWLNGGPGCSSVGQGAFAEIGPYGVNPDGKTLYHREFAWTRSANVIFLESPVGVGFSYSNNTSDYDTRTDKRTAEDTYVFLLTWFERYPMYKGRDLYLSGEGYAGYYVPELADVILNNSKDPSHVISLKGMMVGNGFIDDESDTKGVFDFAWSHSLISDESHQELREKCLKTFHKSTTCSEAIGRIREGMGKFNILSLYTPQCESSIINHAPTNKSHPCDLLYVQTYLNNPHVQAALNANGTNLPYAWEPCSDVIWSKDNPVTMFPVYERLMASGLSILLYSGDVDAYVPASGTRYALARMALEVIEPWSWWSTSDTFDVAGYKVVYRGLTYFTVMGAGHDVSQTHPDKLFHLFDNFIGGEPS